jgi:uncharacterized membrane protein
MNQLTKAQITVSMLTCFSLGWRIIQNAISTSISTYNSPDLLLEPLAFILLQLVAFVIIAFVLMSILKWIDVFDLKTNAILTLVTVVSFGFIVLG